MKRIGIIGSAMNPPHLGHLAMAKYLIKHKIVDKVWLMPANNHVNKQMIETKHMLNMTKLFEEDGIECFDFEIVNNCTGPTIELINLLNEQKYFEKYDLHFVIGQDNANNIDSWVDWEKVLEKIKFIVFPRKGYGNNGSWYLKSPHIYLSDFKGTEYASSIIREKILKGGDVKSLVGDKVNNYIEENKLFKK